jgi:hypothetical protein
VHVEIEFGDTVKVENEGDRLPLFTEVANFGGGRMANVHLNIRIDPSSGVRQL